MKSVIQSACTLTTSVWKLGKNRKVAVPEIVQYFLQTPVYQATR